MLTTDLWEHEDFHTEKGECSMHPLFPRLTHICHPSLAQLRQSSILFSGAFIDDRISRPLHPTEGSVG